MALGHSDEIDISDTEPVDHVAKATVLPKFDMHLYTSSMDETHVKWYTKAYSISVDLHPRVAPEGMTMDELPNDVIRLYLHHFQQGGLRVPFSTFFLGVIDRTGKGCKPCFKDAPMSLKKWKDKFFLVDRRAILVAIVESQNSDLMP
ncbi:hypothetical protein Tco_1280812 [Tanacetum coccineum]